jgi:hypothetical protein
MTAPQGNLQMRRSCLPLGRSALLLATYEGFGGYFGLAKCNLPGNLGS